jgi:hypothetical protein
MENKMTEPVEDKRPWWRKRRIWGGILVGTGTVIATIPGAPVVATLGAITITTVVISTACTTFGSFLLGYGFGAKNVRSGVEK